MMVAAMIPTCQQCGSLLSQLFKYDIINTSTSSSTTFIIIVINSSNAGLTVFRAFDSQKCWPTIFQWNVIFNGLNERSWWVWASYWCITFVKVTYIWKVTAKNIPPSHKKPSLNDRIKYIFEWSSSVLKSATIYNDV